MRKSVYAVAEKGWVSQPDENKRGRAVMVLDHDDCKDKTEAEIQQIRVEKQSKKELEVATYIGNTFLEWQRQGMRSCPITTSMLVLDSLNNFGL